MPVPVLAAGDLRLILTRHAKSAWDAPGLDDAERALAPRGQRSAAELGDWLRSNGLLPDAALVSAARRTRETWEGLGLAAPAPQFLPRLYHASAETMLAVLRQAQGRTVMMIGHNPGIAAFAAALPETQPDHPDFARYPTCATLVVDFSAADWVLVRPRSGRVAAFRLFSGRND